jgi:hypothetical protein
MNETVNRVQCEVCGTYINQTHRYVNQRVS